MATSNRRKRSKKAARSALVVLGSHRSGTSALTRSLSLSGVQLPSHLLEPRDGVPNDGNARAGFWESRRFNPFHDEILRAAGSRWDDPRTFSADWLKSDAAASYASQLAGLIDEEFGASDLFVAKDPRISLLAPLWKAAFARLGVEARWLIAARHPLEVAGSLSRRDGFSEAKGLVLWLNYTLAAEFHTRGETRCFVGFDDLLTDWRATLAKVWSSLGIEPPVGEADAADAIDGFLDPSLRSQKLPTNKGRSDANLPEVVDRLWKWLGPACDKGVEDLEEVREIHRIQDQSRATFQPLIAESSPAERNTRREMEVSEKIDGLRAELTGLGRRLNKVVAEQREQSSDREVELRNKLEALSNSLAALQERQEGFHQQEVLRVEELRFAMAAYKEEEARLGEDLEGKDIALRMKITSVEEAARSLDRSQEQIAQSLESLRNEVVLLRKQGKSPRVKALAFYLPQYHPIPENDEWWGEGFTEWSNVTSAKPLFKGHDQPSLPSELGFYDLRVPEVRERQAALAAEHGIHGFCYYYYWFNGKKLLERPLEEVLASGSPDFPFCICWANENWSRRWDGEEDDVLLAQNHSSASDSDFIEDVLPILLDPRYVRHNGEPVLLVYRASRLENPVATASKWREAARAAGLPGLHLCTVWHEDDPREIGFDALVEFPPHHFAHERASLEGLGFAPDFQGEVFSYEAGVRAVEPLVDRGFPRYRAAMTSWDNTPRRGKAASIWEGSTPELYGKWLEDVVKETASRPGKDDQYVFINAWNEWAEGAVLEPSRAHGRAYLEATRAALRFGSARRSELDRFEDRISAHFARVDRSIDRFGAELEKGRRETEAAAKWLRNEGDEFRSEGSALREEGNELREQGNELREQGNELREQGDAFRRAGDALQEQGVALSAQSAALRKEADALRAVGEEQGKALSWLGEKAEELESQRHELAAGVGWLKNELRLQEGRLTTLAQLQSSSIAQATEPPLRDLWWNSSYGRIPSLLKLPLWLVTGRLRERRHGVRQARRIRLSGLFDESFYLARYPDVADTGLDPLNHYVLCGAGEGRSPSPFFDGRRYLEENPELDPSQENPLLHYLKRGFPTS